MFGIKEIDSHTLKDWQQQGKAIRLVDVRSPSEFLQGMIEQGVQMPLHLLPLRANELPDQEEIVFYCRTGARSAQACMYMMSRGHERVYNLQGGIMDWARQGLPIVAPMGDKE